MLRRCNALDRQIVTNGRIIVIKSSGTGISELERLTFTKSCFFSSLTLVKPQRLPCLESTIIPPPAFQHQHFVKPYPNGMSIMGVTKQIKLKQIQKDQPGAELEEDFEESQYGSCADSDVPPTIARAVGIPGTQEIVPIPPLWSVKVDPQREKDIQIELLDNEKKLKDYSKLKQQKSSKLSNFFYKSINKQGRTNSTTNTTSAPIGSLITNQPDLGLLRCIEEVPGVVLNIDREKREIILEDGSLVPFDMLIIAAGLQDYTIKRLSQSIAKNNFHVDVADRAITMNDEADAIRLQRPPADPDAISLNHERRIKAFECGIKGKYKVGDDEILKLCIFKRRFGNIRSI
ncbi:MAG: hypothetical protein EZS28_016998 [Streblomastix strix]|uniref:FAD/NAD(P)-binding domain-containing protein n=1 Tax=Streblomastix strix TaxID=222440 RepID=A0A5J4VZ09_9EUKA|nr:MAG: hypothetical protein EZS28_016998 [Streblomastix strix]